MDESFVRASELPASFDVTPLLSRVERIENESRRGGGGGGGRGSDGGDSLRRVRLIELDPHHHLQQQQQQPQQTNATSEKTRLFLAVAFGKRSAAAQLFALELGRGDVRDDGDFSAGEGGSDGEEEEEVEWMDASEERIAPCGGRNRTEDANDAGRSASSAVVVSFPPSEADPPPTRPDDAARTSNEGAIDPYGDLAGEEITSCALVPSPSVGRSDPSGRRMMTRRTAALLLGTARGRLLSCLLHVSTSGSSSDGSGIRFALGHEDRGVVEDGRLKLKGGGDGPGRPYPCLNQILPRTRRFDGTMREGDGGGPEERDRDWGDRPDEHMQVMHPSLSPSLCTQQSGSRDESRDEAAKHSGIKSISYCRDAGPNPAATDGAEGGGRVIMSRDSVRITYGNGAIVKLPSWRPFLSFGSVPGCNGGSSAEDPVDSTTHGILADGSSVVPSDCPFRSPLDVPPRQIRHGNPALPGDENEPNSSGLSVANDYWSLLSAAVASSLNSPQHRGNGHGDANDPPSRALVLAGSSAPATTPSIAFNSSRIMCRASPTSPREAASDYGSAAHGEEGGGDRDVSYEDDDDEQYGLATGAVVEGTAALVKGALGAALGAVRWGLGTGAIGDAEDDEESAPPEDFMDVDETARDDADDRDAASWDRRRREGGAAVVDLHPWPSGAAASFPFSDGPRRFEAAVVDPSGALAATTDNLGRVMLFDLETNQPVRMWKGMRNCSCHFAELPCDSDSTAPTRLYLVIHLKQRGTVEVYRLRQGRRVAAISASSQDDCAIVECRGPSSEGGGVDCFILERMDDGDEPAGSRYVIDKLVIDDTDAVVAQTSPARTATTQGENKMQLKLLLQILSPDTNIQCTSRTILATFKSIRALSDLGEGLDAISKCTPEGRSFDPSALHSRAVSICKSRLAEAREAEAREGSGALRKEAMAGLESKAAYHDRLARAYGALRRYEGRGRGEEERSGDCGPTDAGDGRDVPSSPWASEALSWMSLASNAGNDAIQRRLLSAFRHDGHGGDEDEPLEFSKFAAACQSSGSGGIGDRVLLTKVKRSRLLILRRIFRPLLQDLFVFKVVNSIFGQLGIGEDFDVLQKYFGEWANTLPSNDLAKSNMYSTATWRPMIRWLHVLILSAYDVSQQQPGQTQNEPDGDDSLRKAAKLESLLKFIAEMEDLPKAFLLAVICAEAVSSASLQLEQKTYGKITRWECSQPWEELLRKLRTCLLVSLRLGGDVAPSGGGNDPMTVSNVERSNIFSVYSWIARDELCLGHENRFIEALENACLESGEAFRPSSAEGDGHRRMRIVFQSCRGGGGDPRDPAGLEGESTSRCLLFYLRDHARHPARLAAHRALILAGLWGRTPDRMRLLRHAVSALRAMADRAERSGPATLAEVYQSRIRPVCHAMLFGFEGHELSEDAIRPLLEDAAWSREFTALAKRVLSMMLECMSKVSDPTENASQNLEPGLEPSGKTWPPLRECPVLNGLVRKHRGDVQPSSVELHHTIIFAFEMTGSVDSLRSIVPSLSRLFSIRSIYSEMPPLPKASAEQRKLLDKAIVDRAERTREPVLDSFAQIRDVELFGRALGSDAKYVRTRYLIEMIRRGKDASIDDLLGASIGGSSLDRSSFAEEVVRIVCARLDAVISSLKRTKNYRGILSLLDADASRWAREEASAERSARRGIDHAAASLIATHSVAMRLRGMSEGLDDAALSERIEALCLMSGTLLKAVQAQERDAVMSL